MECSIDTLYVWRYSIYNACVQRLKMYLYTETQLLTNIFAINNYKEKERKRRYIGFPIIYKSRHKRGVLYK